MKNAPFFALLGVVAIVVAILLIAVYLQAASGSLPENALSGVCMIAFLVAATIFYEIVAKPGLYLKRKRVEENEEQGTPEDEAAGELKEPESP